MLDRVWDRILDRMLDRIFDRMLNNFLRIAYQYQFPIGPQVCRGKSYGSAFTFSERAKTFSMDATVMVASLTLVDIVDAAAQEMRAATNRPSLERTHEGKISHPYGKHKH